MTAHSRLRAHRRLAEPDVALDAVGRAAEDDLRDRAPDVGERGPKLDVARRRIRLPRQHRLVQPAAAQIAAELTYLRDVETNCSSLGAVHPKAPSRSAMKPSTETLIE